MTILEIIRFSLRKNLLKYVFQTVLKPGTQGASALRECLSYSDDSIVVLVVGGEIESSARRAKWFADWQKNAVVVETKPLGYSQYRNWIRTAMERRQLKFEPNVADRLAYFFEGNMLAAANEIRKLSLGYDGNAITVEQIERIVSDQGRFSIYGLTDSFLAGNLERAVRQLNGLRKEGTAPSYILWALLREMRLVYQYSFVESRRLPVQNFSNAIAYGSRDRI